VLIFRGGESSVGLIGHTYHTAEYLLFTAQKLTSPSYQHLNHIIQRPGIEGSLLLVLPGALRVLTLSTFCHPLGYFNQYQYGNGYGLRATSYGSSVVIVIVIVGY
jgi:hypothetical protein